MPTIVYILAHSRSGSTLLARMLGQITGWQSVGEVRYVWSRGLIDNERCSCGQAFADCGFWGTVVREAYGAVDPAAAQDMAHAIRSGDRVWRMGPVGIHRFRRSRAARHRAEALRLIDRLYAAIATVGQASVIVDSSKSPSYAQLLSSVPGARVHLIHLVRDSRGVAYSRLRRLARGELQSMSPHLLVARTALEWVAVNDLAHRLSAKVPSTLVKYEDLVADPGGTLRHIAQDMGQPVPNLAFLDDADVVLPADHLVSGNQMRFENGRIPLRRDDEWQHKLSRGQILILKSLTFPWMHRYGYP
jgi:Sulfotransferase family